MRISHNLSPFLTGGAIGISDRESLFEWLIFFLKVLWIAGSLASCLWSSKYQQHSMPIGLLCPWDFLGKNTGVACHLLLQGIFLIQESNLCLLCLLHQQADSLPLRHLGSHLFPNQASRHAAHSLPCTVWAFLQALDHRIPNSESSFLK